jgi:uncharacterized protein YqjF (DUF2071 family)
VPERGGGGWPRAPPGAGGMTSPDSRRNGARAGAARGVDRRVLGAPARLRLARVCWALHVLALAGTLLVLLRGLAPGDLAGRREFVATHPAAWGAAWLGWMLVSLSVLVLFAAWAETLGHRRVGRWAVAVTLAGVVLDWVAEIVWIGLAPGWALRARTDAFYADLYAVWDRAYVVLSMGLANGLYTLGALVLTGVSLRTRNFPRWLGVWGMAAWAASSLVSAAAFAGSEAGVTVASAVLFGLLVPWVLLLGHGWLAGVAPRRTRADVRERLAFRGVVRAMVPKHPLPMTTVFRECFLVNFAVRPDVLRRLLPGPIEPDVHAGDAYLSVVIAVMDRMRPAFLPPALGVSFCQVVYRAVVRCRGERGVHFLRSDADSRWMSLAGEWLTFFHFHHSRIALRREGRRVLVDLEPGDRRRAVIQATFDLGRAGRELPRESRFPTLAAAQAFLVELFAAFAYDPVTERVSTVRIERGPWDVRVVPDERGRYDLVQDSDLFPRGAAVLDSVFYARDLPYRWHALER